MSATNQARSDRAHDILRRGRRNPLEVLFSPAGIAVIGASEAHGSAGCAVMRNLEPFPGRVFPINPDAATVLGRETFPDLGSLPERADLAVITTPASGLAAVVRQCGEAGIGVAVILSSGFRDGGEAGAGLEREVLARAREGGVRLLGPDSLGVMLPRAGVNATTAHAMPRAGNVAFLSQSGALCAAVLDWSLRENVGFSGVVSTGAMLDVGWGDLITGFGDDPYTRSILIHMESPGDVRSFLSAAREVALTKPIIVLKAGRTEAAARAAATHTGAMAGDDEVFDAALRRAGVLRVNSIEELFDMAEVLAKQRRPRGPRLAIVTNAGGPGVLAADALAAEGGQLSELSEETHATLEDMMNGRWSRGNPIDTHGEAGPAAYAAAAKRAAEDPNTDGVLAILTPQATADPAETARELAKAAPLHEGKPLFATWMGGPAMDAGEAILNDAGIPTFKYPDRAARAFGLMWRYSQNLRALYETPSPPPASPQAEEARRLARDIIHGARDAARVLLTEVESKRILAAYGIPVVDTRIARTEEEALAHAGDLGYPVVLKLLSETISHKADAGGVHLDVRNAEAVRQVWRRMEAAIGELSGADRTLGMTVQPMIPREGFELIIGSRTDPQFGPVLLFGAGGRLTEVIRDRAFGLPPLNETLARRLMEQTRIHRAISALPGTSAGQSGVEQVLVRFSEVIAEHPWIREMEINPLLVSAGRLVALDARVILHPPETCDLPRPAIRCYPSQYVSPWTLKDGTPVTIRPIRPEDEGAMVRFHATLSARSVYRRYFTPLKFEQRVAHERLSRICFIDYDREIALVVERVDPVSGQPEIIAVGRLSRVHGVNAAEFAIVVSDRCQGQGIGTELLKRLVRIGRDEKLERITGTILPENREMQHVARKAGFTVTHELSSGECHAEIVITHA